MISVATHSLCHNCVNFRRVDNKVLNLVLPFWPTSAQFFPSSMESFNFFHTNGCYLQIKFKNLK